MKTFKLTNSHFDKEDQFKSRFVEYESDNWYFMIGHEGGNYLEEHKQKTYNTRNVSVFLIPKDKKCAPTIAYNGKNTPYNIICYRIIENHSKINERSDEYYEIMNRLNEIINEFLPNYYEKDAKYECI